VFLLLDSLDEARRKSPERTPPTATAKPLLVFVCDWRTVTSAFNRMLKPFGLKLKQQRMYDGDTRDDDQLYLSIVPLAPPAESDVG